MVRPSKLCSRVNFSINMTYTNFLKKFYEIGSILTAVNADTSFKDQLKKK